jgi:guanylate kinase
VEREAFERRRTEGGFVEWNEFLGCLYGTPEPDPGERRDLLLEIDVAGGRQVLDRYPDALCVFVNASDATLRRRLLARGDSTERTEERLAEADRERAEATSLGYRFVANEDLENAVALVAEMIVARRE